ncbi:MAG: hypothetical protein NT056_04810 [Proteobacteria bacterium]|nr:hypothetical protein [Pseudomonadota bacterium]
MSAVSESPPQGFNVNQQGLITRKRSAETTVIAQDKQTVAIGGLMEDQVSESYSRVPILGDIPILGWLFRDSSRMNRKTNLLLFITPYIAKGPAGLEQISRQQENAMVEFYREFRPGSERENIFPNVVGESVIEKRPAPPKEEVIAPAPAPGDAAPPTGKKGKKAAPTSTPSPDLNPPENSGTLPPTEKTEVQPSAPAVPEQNPENKPDSDQTNPSPVPPEDSPAIKPQSLDRQVFGE